MQSLIKVEIEFIESACRVAIAEIDRYRLADKISQVDLLLKDEQSVFVKILGPKPNVLNRDDAEKELLEYADKKKYLPEDEFVWIHYMKDDYNKAKLFLSVCHLAVDKSMMLSIEDASFIQFYLKKI